MGYEVDIQQEVLDDGTKINRLVKIPRAYEYEVIRSNFKTPFTSSGSKSGATR